jgi:hypothetical protein
MRRGIIVAILLLLALQPAYLLSLMALNYAAPAERRAAHIAAAFQEGDHIAPPDASGDWTTECVALAIGLEPGASPLRNAVAAARPNGLVKAKTTCGSLHAAVALGGEDIYWLPYERYWHGYRVILDPLTARLSVDRARYVILVALIAALTFLASESGKLLGREASLALVVPIVAFTDMWRMFYIMEHATATIAILAGSGLFARALRKGAPLEALLPIAAVLGSVFNFLDFLTNPPWQPMMLAFLFLAAPAKPDEQRLVRCTAILAAWAAGYTLTWATKWGLAAALSADPLAKLRDIADVIRFRVDGSYEQMVDHRLLAPSATMIEMTVRQIEKMPWAAMLLMLLPTLGMRDGSLDIRRFGLLALPAALPFVWFEVLSNHTQIHATTTYRPLAASIGVVLASWILAKPGRRDQFARVGSARY